MLTHLDAQGRANMVDVTEKAVTSREALAESLVRMRPETFELIQSGGCSGSSAHCWYPGCQENL